ncbi:MAG: hypothetical protein SFT81_04675 [Candidatus Caenarcaniphilales bacterium]|nr:hypothetical protein [Candidatus Caenarcaniphilales bacterium]
MNKESVSLIGQILVALGKINHEQLDEALKLQSNMPKDARKPLGQILLELDYIDPNDIIEAIRVQMKMRSVENTSPIAESQVSAN